MCIRDRSYVVPYDVKVSTSSARTAISTANAAQPTSPTVKAPSTACATAQLMRAMRPSVPGGRSRRAMRVRRAAQHTRQSAKTAPSAQAPVDITPGSTPAMDICCLSTTMLRTQFRKRMPSASSTSTTAAAHATGLRAATPSTHFPVTRCAVTASTKEHRARYS